MRSKFLFASAFVLIRDESGITETRETDGQERHTNSLIQ